MKIKAPSFTVINTWNEELVKAFGSQVRALRKKKKLSMEQLADLADVEYSQIGKIERGIINTTISTAYRLSEALGISLNELFNFEVRKRATKK